MTRLFSYTIPVDDGAAPNPFGGMCTLTICKPDIRRVAKKGDWVAGLGAVSAPSGNLQGRLVYAMRVDEVVPLKEYDRQAPKRWPHRIPNRSSLDLCARLGDCIYDYSGPVMRQRLGVHLEGDIERDLSGENALVSWHFYYFGRKAIPLRRDLLPICHQTQGHKSDANATLVQPFILWIESYKNGPGMHGWPDTIIDWVGHHGCDECRVGSTVTSC
jgi:hypothetical protein